MAGKFSFSVDEHMARVREEDEKICKKITEESKRRIEKFADEIRAKHSILSNRTSVRDEENAKAPCEAKSGQETTREITTSAADSTTPTTAKTYETTLDSPLSTTSKDAEQEVTTPANCSNASWSSNMSDPQNLVSVGLSNITSLMPESRTNVVASIEGELTTLMIGNSESQMLSPIEEVKILGIEVGPHAIGRIEEIDELTATGALEKIAEVTATGGVANEAEVATTTNLLGLCGQDESSGSCNTPIPCSERPTPTGEVAETPQRVTLSHGCSKSGSFLTFTEMKKLERLLGREDALGRDWRMIADHLGLSPDDIAYIRDKKEEVSIIFGMWKEYGLTRDDLITFLESEKMERHDAADILKEQKASSGAQKCESEGLQRQTRNKEEILTRVMSNKESIRVPRRSRSRRSLQFYDIYLSCDEGAEKKCAKEDFLKICQRNEWLCIHGELFLLGHPKRDVVNEAIEQSSYIVFLIGDEMTEESYHDLNMAFEYAFKHNAYRDGMLIPVPYTENAQLPSDLKPLVGGNLYDRNFEDKMKSIIDVSIRMDRVAALQAQGYE